MAKSADAFRTISEVSDWLDTPAHVLRFWESRFSQVKPVKRAGGRRYYRPADMLLLGGIKKLLHEDGLSIKEAQQVLREQGVKQVARLSRPIDDEAAPAPAADVKSAVDRATSAGGATGNAAAAKAPAAKPRILSAMPEAANLSTPVQADLFAQPAAAETEAGAAPAPSQAAESAVAPDSRAEPGTGPENPTEGTPAQATEPAPETAPASAAGTVTPSAGSGAFLEDPARILALRDRLRARRTGDAAALRPLYERLRALRENMDAPLASKNGK
ncbi:MerR family regulatory protein [Pseudoruegeria aquimaris]|uniref:MerR family regulatory protein n=1 Tax=Pseudoruegeria aquimaris TaxID=393663 RepID=A0A1Y5RAD3_9RHOB|nr:MerR family transcriptional regulator [Pseudoruegeria aquimaris]SLN12469.1 MerR family regulatory protein [Pseudoruegeria aquimaris]